MNSIALGTPALRKRLQNLILTYCDAVSPLARYQALSIVSGEILAKFGTDSAGALTPEQVPEAIELVNAMIERAREAARKRQAIRRTFPRRVS
jgi:hypothetical protein